MSLSLSVPPGGGRFARLPFSRAEADAILAFAPPAARLGLVGFAANRDAVLGGALSRYRILHFATHGVLDSDHPELSGIVLSQVDERGRPRDGFLRAHEIYRLSLPADLVVLSACRTALGREIRGERLVGLTRGFLFAGARSVLVSLWEVEDRATAELMRLFYHHLLVERQPPAAALRAAQSALRRLPGWSAETFWAGFVLQGDWQPPKPSIHAQPKENLMKPQPASKNAGSGKAGKSPQKPARKRGRRRHVEPPIVARIEDGPVDSGGRPWTGPPP